MQGEQDLLVMVFSAAGMALLAVAVTALLIYIGERRRWSGEVLALRAENGALEQELVACRAQENNDEQAAMPSDADAFQDRKLEALGHLAGGVAHDFNNFLSIIDGYARMALKHSTARQPAGHDGAQLETCLERIKQATARGAGLTRQLLMFGRSRIADDKAVDLGRLLRDQEKLLQPLLGVGIGLEINAVSRLHAFCSADGLAQIVMNLVINARDALPEGGNIRITARRAGPVDLAGLVPLAGQGQGYVCLTVSDNGIGMDEEVMARIFDPFFTTKPQGKGTGHGLSVVYGMVRDMKGYVDVASRPGDGTTVTILLPEAENRPVKQIAETNDNVTGLRFEGYTALVVEDEPDLLALTCAMLEDLGMEVLTAADGADALVMQDDYEGDIDLLLADVILPEINGLKLAELIQAVRPETKALFVSGFPAAEVPAQASLLAKPVAFEALAAAIRQCLDENDSPPASAADMPVWQAASA